ncbi:MAG: KUP/HAK/KT family potassium transporter [Burkholderiaceae bacterium]
MRDRMRDDAIDLKSFLDAVFVSPPTRVPGTAVFLVSEQGFTPNALLHNLKHNKVLHETNLFVTVEHLEIPWLELRQALQDRVARSRLLAGDAAASASRTIRMCRRRSSCCKLRGVAARRRWTPATSCLATS